MNAAERQIQTNCTLSELPEKTSVVVNGIKNKTKEHSIVRRTGLKDTSHIEADTSKN